MAWIYLAASEGLPKPWKIGSPQSPIVKTIGTLKEFSCHEWRTGNCPSHLSGTMCEHYWDLFSSQSTSSTAGFHVRTLALREMEKVWQESEADYFSKSCAWPKKQSPRSFSLKTSPQSEHADFQQCSENLPKQGMIVDMVFYPLTTWVRRTLEKDGSCWATPNCMDSLPPRSPETMEKHLNCEARKGRTRSGNLREQVVFPNMWPTPTASESGRTPEQFAENKTRKTKLGGIGLAIAVQMWPTPCADDMSHRKNKYQQGGTALSTQVGGQLNPMWVEWLMGYQTGWTELGALGMQWCPPKRKKLSKD